MEAVCKLLVSFWETFDKPLVNFRYGFDKL